MEIVKGYITLTSEGGRRAQVETLGGKIYDDVLMLYSYGECSNMQSDDTSLVLLLKSMGDDTNIFGVPYNVTLQPALELTEKAVGNFKEGNKITFKANGDIEVLATNNLNVTCVDAEITASGNSTMTTTGNTTLTTSGDTSLTTTGSTTISSTGTTDVTGSTVNMGDAVSLVLNDTATILDSLSAPCTITSAGQTKVNA
jgi:phage gp45-like